LNGILLDLKVIIEKLFCRHRLTLPRDPNNILTVLVQNGKS